MRAPSWPRPKETRGGPQAIVPQHQGHLRAQSDQGASVAVVFLWSELFFQSDGKGRIVSSASPKI